MKVTTAEDLGSEQAKGRSIIVRTAYEGEVRSVLEQGGRNMQPCTNVFIASAEPQT